MDNNNNKRIFLGREKHHEDYFFYIIDINNFQITKKNKISIDPYDPYIEKVLYFKEGDIICVITDSNIYFYFFELKCIFQSRFFESPKEIKNFERYHDAYKPEENSDEMNIKIIEKNDENKFVFYGYYPGNDNCIKIYKIIN